MISKTAAEKMIDQSSLGAEDGKMKLEGIGGGWGYNFGILFIPHEKISIGLAYRSRIKITHEGKIKLKNIAPDLQPLFGGSSFETDAETPAEFPEIISFGIAYRLTRDWTLSFDLEWFGWSSFKESELEIEDEIPEANLTSGSAPLDWKDAWTVKAGAEYQINERLSLRAGYAYVQTQVPEHTLDAYTPDSNQHNFSLGLGYRINTLILDFFYMAGFFEDRVADNAILSGTYENFVHYAGFSIGKEF